MRRLLHLVWGLFCQARSRNTALLSCGGRGCRGCELIPLFGRKGPSLRPDLPYRRAPSADAVQDAACGTGEAGAKRPRRRRARRYHGGQGDILSINSRTGSRRVTHSSAQGDSEGSLPGVAPSAPQPCIRWIARIRTMMQSCASAARLLGGGAHSLPRHGSHGGWRVTAASDRLGPCTAWRMLTRTCVCLPD